jgi:class 3 adenylate cyclase
MERRRAAGLGADVVGYARLMGRDEAGTLARPNRLKAATPDPSIAPARGRAVKLTGDGLAGGGGGRRGPGAGGPGTDIETA